MTAIRIGVFDLCLVTSLTAALAAFVPCVDAPSVAAMPDPSPESLAEPPEQESAMMLDSCDDPEVVAVVIRGRITTLDPSTQASFKIRLADVPSRYEAVSKDDGLFEVRIPRAELGTTDLCTLPMRGSRPAMTFAGARMTVQYKLSFER